MMDWELLSGVVFPKVIRKRPQVARYFMRLAAFVIDLTRRGSELLVGTYDGLIYDAR